VKKLNSEQKSEVKLGLVIVVFFFCCLFTLLARSGESVVDAETYRSATVHEETIAMDARDVWAEIDKLNDRIDAMERVLWAIGGLRDERIPENNR